MLCRQIRRDSCLVLQLLPVSAQPNRSCSALPYSRVFLVSSPGLEWSLLGSLLIGWRMLPKCNKQMYLWEVKSCHSASEHVWAILILYIRDPGSRVPLWQIKSPSETGFCTSGTCIQLLQVASARSLPELGRVPEAQNSFIGSLIQADSVLKNPCSQLVGLGSQWSLVNQLTQVASS